MRHFHHGPASQSASAVIRLALPLRQNDKGGNAAPYDIEIEVTTKAMTTPDVPYA